MKRRNNPAGWRLWQKPYFAESTPATDSCSRGVHYVQGTFGSVSLLCKAQSWITCKSLCLFMVSDRPGLPTDTAMIMVRSSGGLSRFPHPGRCTSVIPGAPGFAFAPGHGYEAGSGGAKPGLPHPGRAAKGRPGASGGVFLVRSIRSIRFI